MKKEQKKDSKTKKDTTNPNETKEKGKIQRKIDYRHDEYAKVNEDPLMKTADLQPRLINIDQFVESRSFELKHFLKILKSKGLALGKLPFQSLPRHMRRRAMSHNYYRVPLRLRYADALERIKEKSGEAVGRSRCRKHLRRSKKLLTLEYRKRVRNEKTGFWLETHIWHAKRFHMKTLWGFKVPYFCNDKSERSTYRFVSHDCCIIDKSYYSWAYLQFKTILELSKFIENHTVKKIPAAVLSGKKCFSTLWLENGKIIFPTQILINPDENQGIFACLILLHPSCIQNFAKLYKNTENMVKFEILDYTKMSTFSIYGKNSLQILANVLLPLACPSQEIFKLIEQISDPSILPNNAIISLKINMPKSKFRMNEGIMKKSTNLEDFRKTDQVVLYKRECNFSMLENNMKNYEEILINWDKKFAYNPLWNLENFKKYVQFSENGDSQIKITSRTRFYHKKKKGDLNKLMEKFKALKLSEKPLPTIPENKMEIEEIKIPAKPLENTVVLQEIKDEKIPSKLQEIYIWILIENNNTTKFGNNIKIMFPAGIGLKMWRRLIYAGAKSIGLKEEYSILHEKGNYIYPDDFVGTDEYNNLKKSEAIELAIEHYRKPVSKRVNFQKTGFQYPFISLWEDLFTKENSDYKISPFIYEIKNLNSLIPIEISMKNNKYVPKTRAIICISEKPDYKNIGEEPKYEKITESKIFNKELEKILNKTSVELYDKEGNLKDQTKKPKKHHENLQKILHPEKISKAADPNLLKSAHKNMEIDTAEYKFEYLSENLRIKIQHNSEEKYKIIGFVTFGRFSLLEGYGKGIGFIKYCKEFEGKLKIDAFIRNPNCRFYYPCTLNLINMKYSI